MAFLFCLTGHMMNTDGYQIQLINQSGIFHNNSRDYLKAIRLVKDSDYSRAYVEVFIDGANPTVNSYYFYFIDIERDSTYAMSTAVSVPTELDSTQKLLASYIIDPYQSIMRYTNLYISSAYGTKHYIDYSSTSSHGGAMIMHCYRTNSSHYDTYLYEGYQKGSTRNRLTKLSQNSVNVYNLQIANTGTDGYAFLMTTSDGLDYRIRIAFLDTFIPNSSWSIIPYEEN